MQRSKNCIMPTSERLAPANDAQKPLGAASDQPEDTATDPLQALRECFNAQLACLNEPDTAETLLQLMEGPCELNGKVIAGKSY